MATEGEIKEIIYNIRSARKGKSVMLNKEGQKLKMGDLIAHHFYKILIHIYAFFLNLRIFDFKIIKKAFFYM